MQRTELVSGQKFNKLTIIERAPNVSNKKMTKTVTAWKCQCDCGKILIIKTSLLTKNKNSQKSCGCAVKESGLSLKPGQKLNRLTTVSYENGFWTCLCECGNIVTVLTAKLKNNNTQSCGCLKSEKAKNNIQKAINSQRKFHPSIGSAQRLWRACKYADGYCDLTFDQWHELSQMPCFYCGINKSNTYNYFLSAKDGSQFAKENGFFSYNGLDRIDSSKYHTLDNVVPACIICNRGKLDRDITEFQQYLKKITINTSFEKPALLPLPTGYLLVSVKCSYRHYAKNYGTMETDLQTFYTYSQLPCFYCGGTGTNYFNVYLNDKKMSPQAKDGAHFYYNGLDRLDNNLGHTPENCVPCCIYCNFAKADLSLMEFHDWIRRTQEFQNKKTEK